MKTIIIPVTSFQQNCTLLWCERTRETAILDPGGELPRIEAALRAQKLNPVRILLTHGHLDHAGGSGELSVRLKIPIEGPHQGDLPWLAGMDSQSEMFGMEKVLPCVPDRWLKQGDRVHFGDEELEVLHCPGHTPGHVVFFHRRHQLALVGDVLFQGSIGRTDFPLSDHSSLLRSIREQLWPLGDNVRFISGHGPGSTFGKERRSNPFLRE